MHERTKMCKNHCCAGSMSAEDFAANAAANRMQRCIQVKCGGKRSCLLERGAGPDAQLAETSDRPIET